MGTYECCEEKEIIGPECFCNSTAYPDAERDIYVS